MPGLRDKAHTDGEGGARPEGRAGVRCRHLTVSDATPCGPGGRRRSEDGRLGPIRPA
jgi:hypothetical protein